MDFTREAFNLQRGWIGAGSCVCFAKTELRRARQASHETSRGSTESGLDCCVGEHWMLFPGQVSESVFTLRNPRSTRGDLGEWRNHFEHHGGQCHD